MSATDIVVQRLRLVAGRGAGAHALRARVEDALRTSSKPPGLAHRFLLIRRLRLSLPREASAQSLALRLEQEWRRLEALAAPMVSAAADAEAVWAVDEVTARMTLLHRWLQGERTEAWFWQRLLPGIVCAAPLAQRLVGLLFEPWAAAADSPSLQRALQRRLWREAWPQIVAAGQGAAAAAALSPRQRERLQPVLRLASAVAESRPQRPGLPPDGVSPPAPWSRPQGPAIEAASLRLMPPPHNGLTVPQALPPEPVSSAPAGVALEPIANRAGTPAAPPFEPPSESAAPLAAPTAVTEPSVDGWATDWAGLWFLLPLLLQLGLAQQPAPARLLAALLQRAATRHELDAPALAWAAQLQKLDDVRADDWWRRARWACVRQARLPMRRLLQRPGRVWLSPQRIDLWLPLARADIRIRRAGFDIDPGYVPWLDCVIHFHYS